MNPPHWPPEKRYENNEDDCPNQLVQHRDQAGSSRIIGKRRNQIDIDRFSESWGDSNSLIRGMCRCKRSTAEFWQDWVRERPLAYLLCSPALSTIDSQDIKSIFTRVILIIHPIANPAIFNKSWTIAQPPPLKKKNTVGCQLAFPINTQL